MFALVPERLRSAYLWAAFFVGPGVGVVLTAVPGAGAVADALLAAVVVHHALFLLSAALSDVR